MAEESTSLTSTFSESTVGTELGVGLVPDEGGTVPLHTALRARTNGCYVFTTTANLEADLGETLREVGVTILDVEAERRSNVAETIVSAPRTACCNRVVVCDGETAADSETSQQLVTNLKMLDSGFVHPCNTISSKGIWGEDSSSGGNIWKDQRRVPSNQAQDTSPASVISQ